MKDHWERVQDLEVIDYQTQGPKKMWTVLLRKAPILERLNIRYRPPSYPRRAGSVVIRSFFNNVAPRLQEFRVPGNFQFNMNTPCFPNIRVFTFPAEYPVPKILSSLKLLPCLTHLRIESHRFIGHPPPPKMGLVEVDLPSLQSLQIVGRDYYDVQALLECITPSFSCGLLLTQGERRLYHIRDPARHIWAYPSRIYDLILKWVLGYIDIRSPNVIKLSHTGLPAKVDGLGSLMISNDSRRWIHSLPAKESVLQVEVVLDASGISFMQELVVSLGLFSAVNRLDVSGMVVPSALYWVYQSFSSVTELVITWLDSSSDMKTWYTRDDGTFQPREEALFPRLHTIIADFSDKLDRIVDYLEYQWEVGLPVCVLDVSQSLSVTAPERVLMRERLGRLNGLIVIWETVLE
ncbi:hypothetical protein CPC08DRAFT_821973 [Agrocybe pediades]|nr:hypothetical protein CPC08DRAFT_821973 [Agrocybe pediades]